MQHIIFGCGDIGRRIVTCLLEQGTPADQIIAFVNSTASFESALNLGLEPRRLDLDQALDSTALGEFSDFSSAYAYYTIAPQKRGESDQRSQSLIEHLRASGLCPSKLVLISTTGVYGDAGGEWIDESAPLQPSTERAKRRAHSEMLWSDYFSESFSGSASKSVLTILRVPGIYARSRLPVARIKQATPVVRSQEVGFTNRIHADDLAAICVLANQQAQSHMVLNATDGQPGTITQYLQAVAAYLGEPALPEISLSEAQTQLSEGMLSYLSESRKISNKRLLDVLDYQFKYPDFKQGMKV